MEQSVTTEFIAPKTRPMMRVVSTHQSLDPEWVKKIDAYAEVRKEKVKQEFIDSPFLLSSFYEFLGRMPKEIKDVEDNVVAGDAREALNQIDEW